jgi:protein-S-isoprenylcysteine O-methyltransferase Ste14
MDNNSGERKKEYHEFMNFAIQGMSENAQFSIAIAVGIFGILSIFVSLDIHNDDEAVQDSFWKNALWTQPPWIQSTGIVLSIAYWALVLWNAKLCYPPFI